MAHAQGFIVVVSSLGFHMHATFPQWLRISTIAELPRGKGAPSISVFAFIRSVGLPKSTKGQGLIAL
jgi:hypothetical protein